MLCKWARLIFAFSFLATAVNSASGQQPVSVNDHRRAALSPNESAASIELETGFEIALIANEPHVIDPVDAAFDDRGRLWVVEMRDYPYSIGESHSGCVRILSDEDGDGRYEKSIVFVDQLDMPTGLALWKDGVVVTLAGRLSWFRDTDGDSKADTEQVWIEGFSRDNEQLRANHPRLGRDGWWYIASGLRGGDVIAGPDFRKSDDQPIKLGSRDVRFDPRTGELEAITGPAQFGLCFDFAGDRIFCSNRNPAVMVRFEQEDLVGNPLAGLVPSVVDILPAGEASKVYPLINAWTTSNLHAGQFTAACGVFVHQFSGEHWSATEFAPENASRSLPSRVLVCEPTGSLIHASLFHGKVEPNKVVKRDSNVEWLASRDAWFRPVNMALSPDGGIVVVDMHRAVIEHPQWVPDELKKRVDERWGNDCGRIYRVSYPSAETKVDQILNHAWTKSLAERPLATRSDAELSQLISSDNAWLRETAWRLMLQRSSAEQFTPLSNIATDPRLSATVRIAALQMACTLSNLETEPQNASHVNQLCVRMLRVEQSNVDVTRAVLKVVKRHYANDLQVLEAIQRLASDPNCDCLADCLLAIGANRAAKPEGFTFHERLRDSLRERLQSDVHGQGELLVAAGLAFKESPHQLLELMLNCLDDGSATSLATGASELYSVAARRLMTATIAKDNAADSIVAALLARTRQSLKSTHGSAIPIALGVIGEILTKREQLPQLSAALESPDLWTDMRTIAEVHPDDSVKQQAILMLSNSPRPADREYLRELADNGALPLRLAAVRAWSKTNDVECERYLFAEFASSSPRVQQVMIELIGAKPTRIAELATRLTEGKLSAKAIGAIELKKLVARAKGDVQRQLQTALVSIENTDRAKVIADYQACLSLNGDALRGKEVFTKHCASCHRIGDVGVQVGPDISDSRTQLPNQILTNILDPNRAIDNNYFRFVALTADDQVVEGMVAEETNDTIVLRGQNNVRTVLRRAEVQELKATGVSLMPDGLEAQIDLQAMADLIAFVKNWRYMDGSIPK